jgi:L-asparaginase II
MKVFISQPMNGRTREECIAERELYYEAFKKWLMANTNDFKFDLFSLIENYDKPTHPLQIALKQKINKMCEVDIDYPTTTDGCGVPILSMPLKNMVKGFLNLQQYPQIINAIKQNPYIYGGENRTDTEIIQKTDNLIAKVGAGGLCVVLNYEQKSAFALKLNDCSYEARRVALFETINWLGWGNIDYDKKIRTIAGKIVGKIEFIRK